MNELIETAQEVYKENFPMETWFGRCVFLSWFCEKGTCKFCYRSTLSHQKKHAKRARRSKESMITDAILGKVLGWKLEYLTGGYGVFSFDEIFKIAKNISQVYKHKTWLNIGTLDESEMDLLKPYVEGICASIETVEPKLHNYLCPDKPIEPYTKMLKLAKKKGFKTAITIVIGLGEKKLDFELLKDYINETNVDRITFYALKPIRGTEFENKESPKIEYYSWWVAKTRIAFPKLEIICGLTPRKVDYVYELLMAGANGFTKFPATKQFASENAFTIENMAKKASRKFIGSLTKLPEIDWDKEVDKYSFDENIDKKIIKEKIQQYIKKMKK